ncbi:hypothetical protein E4U30_002484 [Claviceps sp. LM220 group G6]|nr:hypothetical protein E4U30_002484 [Claviceps sp. LM220 group G6]
MEATLSPQQSHEVAAMDNFQYLHKHELVICKEHGYARPKSHFATIPRSPTDCTRGCSIAERKLWTSHRPHRGAGPPGRDLWISSQRATIARHCRTHGWRSTPDDREYWTDVWVQSFCLTSEKQRWFPVYVDEGPLPPDERRSAEIQAILDDIKLEHAVYQAKKGREEDERNARMYPMLNTPLTDLEITFMYQSCWLERTGWDLHLWESNLAHLAHAARLPGKDEPELEVIAAAIEDLIEDCVKGLASLPLDIRRWLRSDHPTIMHPRPMGRLTNRIVHHKYANIWKRLICYSLRVAQSEESHEAESPSPFVKKEENEAKSKASIHTRRRVRIHCHW